MAQVRADARAIIAVCRLAAPSWPAPEPGRRACGRPRAERSCEPASARRAWPRTGLLGGCRLRLEDDAPAVPFLPRRSIPDEALLLQTHREVRDLAVMAAAVSAAPTLAAQHERQAQVLRSILSTGGVPASVIDATPAPTSTTVSGSAAPTAPATSTGVATPAALAAAEAQAVTPAALTALSSAVAQRPLLVAISAQRAAAAALLGAAPSWPSGLALPADAAAGGARTDPPGRIRRPGRRGTHPASGRAPYLDLLGTLQRREAALRLGRGDVGG